MFTLSGGDWSAWIVRSTIITDNVELKIIFKSRIFPNLLTKQLFIVDYQSMWATGQWTVTTELISNVLRAMLIFRIHFVFIFHSTLIHSYESSMRGLNKSISQTQCQPAVGNNIHLNE